MKRIMSIPILLTGFTAMTSQIVFLREFLIVFYGNELSIGFILASWLVGGAIGSWLLGRMADRQREKVAVFAACQLALGILLPSGIIAVRSIKAVLDIAQGAFMPFFPMITSGFIILVPICAVFGFIFSLACSIYGEGRSQAVSGIGKVYILEAMGATAGGVVAGFVLIRLLPSIHIAAILSALNIASALFLSLYKTRSRRILLTISAIMFMMNISMWLSNGWGRLNDYSLARQWRGYKLVSAQNSIYGNVAVTKNEPQFSFFDNGLHLYTIPDRLWAEETVHFALLEHPSPENVLLIGGGAGGVAEEVLKHPIKRCDYIELDPLIVNMAKTYLPAGYLEPLNDPRISIKFEDGRRFVKTTGEKYDCVIISLGDPYTAQINRYYTVEFFEEVRNILREGGIISFGLSSSESYMNKELKAFLHSIYLSVAQVFDEVKIVPGDTADFLGCAGKGRLTYDYKILMERSRERGLDLRYVREYYLFSKLSPEKIGYIERSIRDGSGIGKNYDFRPISYYYGITFWATRFRDSLFGRVLQAATKQWVLWTAAFIALILIISYWLFGNRDRTCFKKAVLTAVMTTGLSTMVFQIMILLAFQIIYGYLFYKLGVIITFFMTGLGAGGWSSMKLMQRFKNAAGGAFIWSQAAMVIYSLILPPAFLCLSRSKAVSISWLSSNVIFLSLPLAAGFLGGFRFPLANRICLDKEGGAGKTAGLNYGLDLLGSCIGTLLAATFLIPVIGIFNTSWAVAALNLIILLLLLFSPALPRSETQS